MLAGFKLDFFIGDKHYMLQNTANKSEGIIECLKKNMIDSLNTMIQKGDYKIVKDEQK